MGERTEYAHGVFSWMDLSAVDMGAAKAWYAELFGWEPVDQDTGGGPPYTNFYIDGKVVAGLGQLSDEMKAGGVPPTWNTYITVDDVDAVAKAVEAGGGGSLFPPMKVMDAGWMGWFTDPEGAAFAVWKPDRHIGAQLVNQHGTLCWNELNTRDIAKAESFYGSIFGWGSEDLPSSAAAYKGLTLEGRHLGGMLQMTEEWGEMPAHWMVYIAVDDVKASISKIEATGGKVHVPPTEIPPGTFSVVADPQGALFTIIELSSPVQ